VIPFWPERISSYTTRPIAGMTVLDVASAMGVPVIMTEDRYAHPGLDVGRAPGYATLAFAGIDVVIYCCDPGIDGIADVLHELAHACHGDSFRDELPIIVWQSMMITYMEPNLADALAENIEGYYVDWQGSSGRPGTISLFEDWIRSEDFRELRKVASEMGIVDEHGPLLRRINL